jgi:hypothetical protein
MTITNSTDFPLPFLRRLIAYIAKELGMKQSLIRRAEFRKSRSAWGGRAYLHQARIGVRVGDKSWFPAPCRGGFTIQDRLDALVMVTAHEMAHHMQYHEGSRTRLRGGHGGSERHTDHLTYQVVNQFRKDKESLLAQ